MKKTILLDEQPETRLHPRTGELLKPLFTWRGRDVWPVIGGDGEEDDDSDSEPDDDSEAEETEDKESSSGVSRADYDKLKAQLRAADKGKSDLAKRLQAIEDKDKSELDKATGRVSELEKANSDMTAELAELRLQNAFLTANTGVTWHDPGDALAVAQRQGYLKEVIGEDGSVDTALLGTKLKEMAKAKPHMVVKSEGGSNGKDKESGGTVKTGANVGGKGKGQDKGLDLSRYSRYLNT